MKLFKLFSIVLSVGVVAGTCVSLVYADHSWGGYHWARTTNPFTLKLGDNVSAAWDSYLATSANDWSASSVLDTAVVTGVANPKTCKPVTGRVEVCNSKYGNNGWLGIASIWASGNHITKGTVKMNDTYFGTKKYNTPAWRNLVLCQEIGHTFGLDHQDEDFNNANLGTCMDYASDPTSNQHPNAHDYEMLETIYAHLDSFTTVLQSTASGNAGQDIDHANPKSWGREIRKSKDNRGVLYAKDLGKGETVFTFVIWADVISSEHE